MRTPLLTIAMLLVAYFVGSIPSGFLVIKALTGKDIRRYGSGNIGMANAYRVGGAIPALLVLLGDALKGAIPVLVARWALGLPDLAVVLVGLVAIVGHDFPIYLRGHGGKGVATSIGVITALVWPVGVLAMAVWVLVIGVWRFASLASLLMLAAAAVFMLAYERLAADHHPLFVAFVVALLLVAIVQHRANIGRLLHGRELKITDPVSPEKPA
ncbi:MAG TPA: glycerol-3-phosphate 1-O-acyltransferase PlsY [Thermomicrobiales bacterium]|nr:glycerol-3-phosphate 1-O-acyltransferase PlsY [Thermomicrobiales bacterium]